MKRQTILTLSFICFLIVFVSLISAQDLTLTPGEDTSTPQEEKEQSTPPNQETQELPEVDNKTNQEKTNIAEDPKKAAQEIGEGAKEAVKEGFLGIGVSNSSEVETLTLPRFIEEPSKLIFGINDNENISLEKFIVLIAVAIMVFVVLLSLVELLPFFENKKFIQVLFSLLVFGIFCVTGTINFIITSIYDITNFSNWIQEIGVFRFLLVILLVAILLASLPHIRRFIRRSNARAKGERISHAQEETMTAGRAAEKFNESLSK
jgi:hypothetical protein